MQKRVYLDLQSIWMSLLGKFRKENHNYNHSYDSNYDTVTLNMYADDAVLFR